MVDLSLIHASPFYELTALLALAIVVGFLGKLLRQPMIVSFIVVGLLARPSALGIVQSYHSIELLAELGVAVLLFLVGLKLDLNLIRTLGPVALATGLGQVLFTSVIGFFLGLALGLPMVTSVYVAVALTFSSTIIIVKLLSDKKEVDSLHGRIAIGFLIVQDLVVVLAMMVLSAFGIGASGESEGNILLQIGTVIGYGALMLALVAVFIRYFAAPLTGRIAHSPELLIIFAIGWAAILGSLGDFFGFSKELGGLLAGLSLASTPYRELIVARLTSLRDFLLLFFFVALGAQLDLASMGAQVMPALAFSLFVLIGNPLIVLAILGYMGYRKRTGFLAGLTVAQISEFSLIFMAMGVTLGHVSQESLGLVTLVGLITIALSVYMITYSHTLYRVVEPVLYFFERRAPMREMAASKEEIERQHCDAIVFGLGRYGGAIADRMTKEGFRVLGVDFNPDQVRRRRSSATKVVYGDASDLEFIGSLPLGHVRWVISALPQHALGVTHEDPRLTLIEGLKSQKYAGRIAVSTQHPEDVPTLQEKGADMVFQPYFDAANRAVEQLKEIEKNTAKLRDPPR